MQPAISLNRVTKRYGQHVAVADLTLAVAPGEMLGFLGPNGAGKTTTIRLLMGFLRPDAGSVRLLGYDMADPAQARDRSTAVGLRSRCSRLGTRRYGQLAARRAGTPAGPAARRSRGAARHVGVGAR